MKNSRQNLFSQMEMLIETFPEKKIDMLRLLRAATGMKLKTAWRVLRNAEATDNPQEALRAEINRLRAIAFVRPLDRIIVPDDLDPFEAVRFEIAMLSEIWEDHFDTPEDAIHYYFHAKVPQRQMTA